MGASAAWFYEEQPSPPPKLNSKQNTSALLFGNCMKRVNAENENESDSSFKHSMHFAVLAPVFDFVKQSQIRLCGTTNYEL